MPIHNNRDSDSYLRVKRIYTHSADGISETSGTAYRVLLDEEVRDVLAIELSGFSVSNRIAPTFVAERNGLPGDNKIDFYVIEKTPGPFFGRTSVMTAVISSERYTHLSYAAALEEAIEAALGADPYFNFLWPDVTCTENNPFTSVELFGGTIEWGFLFATGVNASRAPHQTMGFEALDYTTTTGTLLGTLPVNMQPYRYVKIKVHECEKDGDVARIFIGNDNNFTLNEVNTNRARLLSADNLGRVRHLTITPSLGKGMHVPANIPLDLEFSILHVANQGDKPAWLKEKLTL